MPVIMKKQLRIFLALFGLSMIVLSPCITNAQEQWWSKWEKNMLFNPVIQYGPDSWFYHAKNSAVIHDDSTYRMWFTGFGGIDDYRRIGYAESTNGNSWDIHHEEPVLSGTVLGSHTYIGSVLKINDTLKMWYSGKELLIEQGKIGYAWSLDGYNWNEHHEAVLNPGSPGSWDHTDLNFPCVIYDGTSYHMYYGNTLGIGYATSPNGIDWTRDTVHSPIHWVTPGTF
jgi:hypothetical protein